MSSLPYFWLFCVKHLVEGVINIFFLKLFTKWKGPNPTRLQSFSLPHPHLCETQIFRMNKKKSLDKSVISKFSVVSLKIKISLKVSVISHISFSVLRMYMAKLINHNGIEENNFIKNVWNNAAALVAHWHPYNRKNLYVGPCTEAACWEHFKNGKSLYILHRTAPVKRRIHVNSWQSRHYCGL